MATLCEECEIRDLNVVGRVEMKKKYRFLLLRNKEQRYLQHVEGFLSPLIVHLLLYLYIECIYASILLKVRWYYCFCTKLNNNTN